jgi:DNA polymerase-3 subunit beta
LETVYDGQTLEIGFNSRYLLDIIAQIQTERTALALSDVAAPTIVTEPNSTDALYVIMPMRV